jgi:septum formation protein
MSDAELILASQSPLRRMLLESVGLSPKVIAPAIDETPSEGERPIPYALRVARAKAESIDAAGRIVLAADTVVAIDGAILGKAADAGDAERMLALLSGRTHVVHTAVVVRSSSAPAEGGVRSNLELFEVVSSEVRFRRLTNEEIARYVRTGEPMDKAGAYGIQGRGGALVAAVNGSYTNVVGLPLEETLGLLRLAGVR